MKRSLFLQILVRAAVACALLCAALLLTRDLWVAVLAALDGFVAAGREYSAALAAGRNGAGGGSQCVGRRSRDPTAAGVQRVRPACGDDPHGRRRAAAQLCGERGAAREAGGAAGLDAGCGHVDRFVGAHHLGEQGDAAAGGGLVRLGARGLLAGADDSRAGGAALRARGARDEEVLRAEAGLAGAGQGVCVSVRRRCRRAVRWSCCAM